MADENKNPLVDVVATRGTFCKGFGDLKIGDKFEVPEKDMIDGVPPLRWWEYTRKAARPEEAKRIIAELDKQVTKALADSGA